jgi:hypothetical protein
LLLIKKTDLNLKIKKKLHKKSNNSIQIEAIFEFNNFKDMEQVLENL